MWLAGKEGVALRVPFLPKSCIKLFSASTCRIRFHFNSLSIVEPSISLIISTQIACLACSQNWIVMADLNTVPTVAPIAKNPPKHKPRKRVKKAVWIPFIGSMNLAVTLLMMLAIGSIIGTFLQQGQPLQDYILKFGPFWTQVFGELGLFQMFSALWFVIILVFLLISTATCVTRNAPTFIKDIRQFSEKLSLNAYKHQPYNETFVVEGFDENTANTLLKGQGYRTRIHQRRDGITVAGMKGRWNRLGYIFTHISIIIICVGALFDSNLLLKYREITGDLEPELRSVPIAEIPDESWIGPNNFSFRGSVNIPEGRKTDVVFLPYRAGFLVQQLPFTIFVEDFRIGYYDTGMPKYYRSDLVLTSPDLDEPIVQTISVNEPLFYKDFAIYQSSYADGGSLLDLKIHPLLSPIRNYLVIDTAINRVEPLDTPVGVFKLELNDFRMFNIIPTTEEVLEETGKQYHNNGPSVIFRVRNEQGKAWEYDNYMMPSYHEGRWFFMSGVRTMATDPFLYLFIPADANRKKDRFFNFLSLLNNPVEKAKILTLAMPRPVDMATEDYQMQMSLRHQLLALFRHQGFEGITRFVNQSVPEAEREKVAEFYIELTSTSLQTIYLELLSREKQEKDNEVADYTEVSDFDQQWFEDAITAVSGLYDYGVPMFVELTSFQQIQSTGLQITKSPGKNVVFFGSTVLIFGIFFLFYVRQKRVWIVFSKENKEVTIAAKDTKDVPETKIEFNEIVELYKRDLCTSGVRVKN